MPLTATFAADFQNFVRGLDQAQVKLTVFDRATKNATRSLTRELDAISGQKVAAEAARMAEAVKRLGGEGGVAAGLLKLTDAELRRVTATMDAATAKAGKLGEALPASLKQVNAEIAKLPKPIEESNRGLGLLDSTFTKLTASLTAAGLAERVITAAIDGVGDFVARGGEVAAMRQGFIALSGGVEAANNRIGAIRVATQGLVTDMDAMQASNKATLLGLGLSDERMGELAKTAAVLGRAMGQGATKSLDDLITALGRSSPMILDNLGLSVKVGEANEKYAAALGKSAEALTDAERKQAFMNAALDAANEKVQTLGGLQLNAADRANQLWTGIKNLADATASWAVSLGPVNYALEQTVDSMKLWETLLRTGKLSETLKEYRRQIGELGPERTTDIALTKEATASTKSYVNQLVDAGIKLNAFMNPANAARQAELNAAIEVGGDAAAKLAKSMGLSELAFAMYREEMQKTQQQTSAAAREAERASTAFANQIKVLSGASALEDARRAVQELSALGGPGKVLLSQLDGLAARFKAGAEAAQLLGDVELARDFQLMARTLTPIIQFQQRYNVTIGEYVTAADDATQAILDQNAALAETETRFFGILPAIQTATNALVPFKAAAAENPSSTPFFDIVRENLDTLEDHLGSSANAFARLGQVSGRGMGQVAEAVAIAAQAVSDFNDVLDEAAEGDKLGTALAAVKLGVNLLASVWDGLTTSAGEQAAREAGRHFGVLITEEMGNAIAADADKLFRGDRFAASIFNLSDIIGADGGLTADNLARMTARLRDVFVLVETGSFTSAQAVSVLDDNFQDFIEAATDGSGRLSQEMVEIIRLTREFGLESAAVTGYVRDQAQTAIAGANAVIGYLSQQYDAYQDIADGIREAQERIDELNRTTEGGRGVEWTRDMAKAQEDLTRFLSEQHAAGEAVRGELELVGQIAVGVYGAAVDAGLSHSEALKAALPGLSQLVTAYENLGISATDAGLAALLPQAELLRNNPQLLAGVDGLAQSFTALSNLGLLNADTFQQMEQAALMMFTRIQGELAAQGVDMSTNLQALIPMQDYLRQAAEQAALLGVALDPTTQMLIDQSKELGLWKDTGEDGAATLQDAIGDLTDAVRELDKVFRGLPRMVTTDVTTRYHQEGESRTLPAPTPPVSPAAAARADQAGRAGGDITTRVYLDGREVAVAIAPHRRAAERAWGAD
ncbi:MAG: hypothetical protein AB7R67_21860 [Vicinamibacterales bacterium]